MESSVAYEIKYENKILKIFYNNLNILIDMFL